MWALGGCGFDMLQVCIVVSAERDLVLNAALACS